MGLDNPIHIAFLLVALLLVFGAKRLPELGRSLGGGMRGFKDAISGADGALGVPHEAHVGETHSAPAQPVGALPAAAPAASSAPGSLAAAAVPAAPDAQPPAPALALAAAHAPAAAQAPAPSPLSA